MRHVAPLRFRRLFAALALGSAAASCHHGAGRPAGDEVVHANLTVKPQAEGRQQAVIELKPSEALKAVEVHFVVPAECRIVAGAASRTLPDVAAGQAQPTAIEFECPPGKKGKVSAEVKGTRPSGAVLALTYEAAF